MSASTKCFIGALLKFECRLFIEPRLERNPRQGWHQLPLPVSLATKCVCPTLWRDPVGKLAREAQEVRPVRPVHGAMRAHAHDPRARQSTPSTNRYGRAARAKASTNPSILQGSTASTTAPVTPTPPWLLEDGADLCPGGGTADGREGIETALEIGTLCSGMAHSNGSGRTKRWRHPGRWLI